MDTKFDFDLKPGAGPKYQRLFNALERGVRTGSLPSGTRLPPVRQLAWHLSVTPGTVARAYQMATDRGLLEATVGRGTFVRAQNRSLPTPPENLVASPTVEGFLNFRNGHTLDIGQSALIADLIRDIAGDDTLNLAQYVPDTALHRCRDLTTAWLNAHGVPGQSDDLVLTHGAHNSVMIALSSILSGRDPVVATTHLTYPGFRQSAHICRARMVGVDSDENGIRPDAFERVCRADRPQALIVSSNVHNPTCTYTPIDRRRALAALAERYDVQIIEDDVYGTMVPHQTEGYMALVPDRTWHATSLSKCFAAGLRIGFLLCPPGKGGLGIRVMQGMSLSISQFLTRLVERIFETGVVTETSAQLASENTSRVEVARHVLKDWGIASQNAVNFVWIRKPEGWNSSAFLSACAAAEILVAPGDSFTLPGGQAPNAVRLTLSAAQSYEELRGGLDRIDQILRNPPRAMLA